MAQTTQNLAANRVDKVPSTYSLDVESKAGEDNGLRNTAVQTFAWQGITVTVKDRATKQLKAIVDNVSGLVDAGEMLAIMGPSGCGKTTLLNVLARRESAGTRVTGSSLINGSRPATEAFRKLTCYVEQEDALIGSITVRETLNFAARLAGHNLSKRERIARIESLLDSFGLRAQANTIIGTPIRKGISGGQKRRVSVASQLITGPNVLFLDEPTSGLDSAASFEVMSFIRAVAKKNNASPRILLILIHQPSTTTFQLFDKLLLLSTGRTHYLGPINDVDSYFGSQGLSLPLHMNPAEFVLELMNTDFATDRDSAVASLDVMHRHWLDSAHNADISNGISQLVTSAHEHTSLEASIPRVQFFSVVLTLTHRSFIKSYRDVIAYGVRIAMYLGLAILMGTVWLRLDTDQSSIIPFSNGIFFGSAFMSFMAVAYIPSILEDRLTFVKERANGLYGAAAFTVSNFIVGVPYLFLITVLFSSIAYWLGNFQPTAEAFFTWIMWLFLDLLAAESLVVMISSIFPIFVVSLAITAFANGLWMCVGGFLVTPTILNVFWRYVFHYIDYQAYVFQGMMVNEFANRTYRCGSDCKCMYASELESQCLIDGKAVLAQYGYSEGNTGKWVGILLAITLGYRLLGWLALTLRK